MEQQLTPAIPAELELVTKQSGLEKATTYAAIFSPFMVMVKQLSDKAAAINKEQPTALDAKLAREVRLALVKNRTATAAQKDKSKADLMAEANLIQNLHNVVINTSQLIEADLAAVEKFAEIEAAKKAEELRIARAELLQPYVEDCGIYPLGTMTDNAFNDLLEGSRLQFERKAEEARKAEEERAAKEAAEKLEQERVRQENEKLKAEAIEKERLAKIESDRVTAEKAEAERINAEKIAAIEEANRIAREKAAKEQAEKDAELKAAQYAAAKAEAELRAKKDAEAKAEQDKVAAEKAEAARVAAEAKKAAKAPDKQKLTAAVESLQWPVVLFTTDDGERVHNEIRAKFAAFKIWAVKQIETL